MIAEELIEKIKNERINSRYEFIVVTIFCIVYGLFTYFTSFGSKLFITICFDVVFYCYYMYVTTVRKNLIINRIIIEIVASDNEITFITPEVKLFHLFRKKSTSLILKKNEINLNTVDFPLKKTFKYTGKILGINNNFKDDYILLDFFAGPLPDGIENI